MKQTNRLGMAFIILLLSGCSGLSDAPGKDKIKADLVERKVCGWYIDSISNFRELEVRKRAGNSEIAEYDLHVELERQQEDAIIDARAVYKRRSGDWLLSSFSPSNCTSTREIAQARAEAERKAREEAEKKRIAEEKRRIAEEKRRIAEEKRRIAEEKRQAEEERMAQRFTDNGDGTVTDGKTGLMWKRCAEGLSGEDCSVGKRIHLKWQEAMNHAEKAEFAGHDDWRLPDKDELLSLVNKFYHPAIYPGAFPHTKASYFWSASPSADYSGDAWNVHFANGYANKNYGGGYEGMRLVRGPLGGDGTRGME